ncbi:MAG TPA: arginine--tRNA ligase [Candidatus Scatovivens faecipullorum]|nr:arginine--tRNA ligase [Candidatus Scatovivens faecipullorum]
MDFKKIIGEKIAKAIEMKASEITSYIEIPPNTDMGDYAFPCFKLAKELKKAPPLIANEIKEKLELGENIEKVEIIGGYLNFYINKLALTKNVLVEIDKAGNNYGSNNTGNGKTILVEYSSPNIAKPFHIGHLRNTVIGAALYNIYKYLGYNTIGINHLGDYGTQFGKMIEGYKRWGKEYDLESNPIDECMKIYVRINNLCKEDENVLEICRENFKKIEEGDPYCVEVWNKFKDLSLKEFQKIYDLLGVKFDSLKGEAFYSDKMDEVVEKLETKGVLKDSEGAKIVDLEDKGLGVCMIKKSNGSTIYATRDLAAVLYRARTYNFDKCLYVVAYEQNLHFKQIFEVAKYLDIPEKCLKGLEHVAYGMVRLTTGKMSTREGTVVKVEELLDEAVDRVEKIIEEKNPNMQNKKEEAKKIGIGAVIFNNVCSTIIKDQVFDWNIALNFNGETGPYIQYVYVRTKSVLEKANYIPKIEEIDFNLLQDKESLKVIRTLYNFEDVLMSIVQKNEPSILARYLIELSQNYSNFYNENKIIDEDKNLQNARVYLTKAVGTVLKTGANLLGIQMPDRM